MSSRLPKSFHGIVLATLKAYPDELPAAIKRLGMHRPDGRHHDWQSMSRALHRAMRFPMTVAILRDALLILGRRDIVTQLDTAGLLIGTATPPTSNATKPAGTTLQ